MSELFLNLCVINNYIMGWHAGAIRTTTTHFVQANLNVPRPFTSGLYPSIQVCAPLILLSEHMDSSATFQVFGETNEPNSEPRLCKHNPAAFQLDIATVSRIVLCNDG
jgi:hypothetical protein